MPADRQGAIIAAGRGRQGLDPANAGRRGCANVERTPSAASRRFYALLAEVAREDPGRSS